ncbi:MAG: transposase family protein [Nitrososphaerota archaeon]|nr:transposase family protein [Nitrososphaerota archaeon]
MLGGPKPKLCLEAMLFAVLEYIREYRTYAHVAASYCLSESQNFRIIRWVENTSIKDGTFSLPGRKALLKSDMEYEVVLIDATESPMSALKKQRHYYSGKKKRHTIKSQVVVNNLSFNSILYTTDNSIFDVVFPCTQQYTQKFQICSV